LFLSWSYYLTLIYIIVVSSFCYLLQFSYLGDLKSLFYVYYIKKSNFNFKNKNNSILHLYENYFTVTLHCISIKNIEFYIEIGYFIFYIFLYLHQAHLCSSLLILSWSYYLTLIYIIIVSSFCYLFIFSYLYDLKSLFYVYYIKKSNFNFKNKNNSNLHFYENYFTLPYIVFQLRI